MEEDNNIDFKLAEQLFDIEDWNKRLLLASTNDEEVKEVREKQALVQEQLSKLYVK